MPNIVFKEIKSMAAVQRLGDPMKFNVLLECVKEIPDDVEFEITYSCDARCDDHDQKIGTMLVGPIPVGRISFVLETDPVDVGSIRPEQVFGVTSVIFVGKYRAQQFLRIGYVINVRYPGIPDSKLTCEEADSQEEDIGESTSCDEECSGEEAVNGESAEDEGIDSGYEEQDYEECSSAEAGGIRDATKRRGSESGLGGERDTQGGHGLRTRGECIGSNKHKEATEQLREELEEEVHESSFSEVQEEMEKTVYCEDEGNEITVNGLVLDRTKIEAEFMEPPVTTVFEIDWDLWKDAEHGGCDRVKRPRRVSE